MGAGGEYQRSHLAEQGLVAIEEYEQVFQKVRTLQKDLVRKDEGLRTAREAFLREKEKVAELEERVKELKTNLSRRVGEVERKVGGRFSFSAEEATAGLGRRDLLCGGFVS